MHTHAALHLTAHTMHCGGLSIRHQDVYVIRKRILQ